MSTSQGPQPMEDVTATDIPMHAPQPTPVMPPVSVASSTPRTGHKRLGPAPPIDLFKKSSSMGPLAEVSLAQLGVTQPQLQSHQPSQLSQPPLQQEEAPPPIQQRQPRINAENISKDSKIKFRAEDLQTIVILGAGSGGVVSKVLHTPTGKFMARKSIRMGMMEQAEQDRLEKQIMRELRILRLCRSPRVVAFHGAFLQDGDINIMMEYMDLGTLETVYRKIGVIPEPIVAHMTLHILEGLIYLYDNHKIVHRDIKPSNILVNSLGEVKIADFGVSKELSTGTQAVTFTGTQGYLAPERVRDGVACTSASDVWSLGLTVMEISLGAFPIPAEALATIFDLLQFIEEEPSPTLPAGRFSPEFHEFTSLCMVKDPQNRAHPQQLLDAAFVNQAKQSPPEMLSSWAQTLVPLLQK